jgi:proline iminopeptidase
VVRFVDDHVNGSGFLDSGDGHKIFWEDWGNPAGVPVVFLHGGPGGGCDPAHRTLFDPRRHRVLFHDQRGCGRSRPTASTDNNTTAHLIGDIRALMNQVGWESAHVAGGSWGSALALLFAIAHPDRVRSLLVWGVYLARREENDWVNAGGPRSHFPQEWERFIAPVPTDRRGSGDAVMRYYAEQMRSRDSAHAYRFALEWTRWEAALVSLSYQPGQLDRRLSDDPATMVTALLETHYFGNGCFVPENAILENLATIRSIRCHIVQGRFDMCTPPVSAHELAGAYGGNASLQWVNAGHLYTDPELQAALIAAAATFGHP